MSDHRRRRRLSPHPNHTLTLRPLRYPKHVWSPAGGWYAQPKNWKANTVVAGLVMFGIVVVTWRFSGEREMRARKPEPGGFYPSRWYVTRSS